MKYKITFSLFLLISLFTNNTLAQSANTSTITGQVTDVETGAPIEFATIYIKENTSYSTEASVNGNYEIVVPHNKKFTLLITRTGYKEGKLVISPMRTGEVRSVDIKLALTESTLEVIVTASNLEEAAMVREEVDALKYIPTTSLNIGCLLYTSPSPRDATLSRMPSSA